MMRDILGLMEELVKTKVMNVNTMYSAYIIIKMRLMFAFGSQGADRRAK